MKRIHNRLMLLYCIYHTEGIVVTDCSFVHLSTNNTSKKSVKQNSELIRWPLSGSVLAILLLRVKEYVTYARIIFLWKYINYITESFQALLNSMRNLQNNLETESDNYGKVHTVA